MNFKQEMINRVTKNIELLISHGKTRDEAIEETKKETVAGPAVWNEVLNNI